MTDPQYEMNYDGPARQDNIPSDAPAPVSAIVNRLPPKKRFRIPEVAKSALLIAGGAALFLASEAVLPDGNRLTDLFGLSNARYELQRVRMEKQAQAELDAYVRAVEVANQQNIEMAKAQLQSQLQYYDASYARTKIFVEATARMQQSLIQSRIELASRAQGGDVGIINLTRMFGRVANAVEPGAGDSALGYAEALKNELYGELDRSVQTGTTVSIEGWDTDLPSPYEVRAQIATLEFTPLPAPPKIGLAPASDKAAEH